jgi:hypothetical protein
LQVEWPWRGLERIHVQVYDEMPGGSGP